MKTQMIRFADIPLELIEQKESFARTAIPILEAHPDLYAVEILRDDGVRIGVAWFIKDRLYDQLVVDTIIIDEQYRGVRVMKEAYKLLHEVALELARSLVAKRVIGTTHSPRLFDRMFENAKFESYIYYEEV